MARHNVCFLFGSIADKPKVLSRDGVEVLAQAFLNVVRGPRAVGDHRKTEKFDKPVIIGANPTIIEQMKTWEPNDIIFVKGSIATRKVKKKSQCTNCGADNTVEGVMVCIYPIWTARLMSMPDEQAAIDWLVDNKEISNQVYAIGNLTRDPKKISPKSNLIVTQYPIAIGRKYHFQQDPPEIKTDYPWVKAYGENAVSDRERLKIGSEIYVDGCIQARNVMRHHVCESCGQAYDWRDRAMEIVPFETEYLNSYYTDEEVQERIEQRAIQSQNDILRNALRRTADIPDEDDVVTENDIEAGFDTMGKANN